MTDNDKLPTEPVELVPPSVMPSVGMMSSPVDLPPPEEEEQQPLLWTSIVIAVATGFLLLFNASAIRSWAFDLEPGPQSEQVVMLADDWYERTEIFYLDRPVVVMSGWWNAIKALEFGSDEAAGETEDLIDDAASSGANEPAPAAEEPEGPGFSVQ